MELKLVRIALRPTYTIGKLYIDGAYVCDTLEDTVRDLNKNGVFDGDEKKVYGETAIPYGRYEITMNVISPKFFQKAAYKWSGGYLPRLLNVPHFDGILIHAGNSAFDSAGCVLVGRNTVVGRLTESMDTLRYAVYPPLKAAAARGEKIYITII